MSVHNLNVPQIGLKLDLLLRTGKQGIKTASALSKRLNIAPDHLSRIKNGTRSIPDEVFLELTNIYQIEQKIWFENLEVFGQSLGLSSQEVSKIIGIRIPGIDFSSRITDKRMIKDIHRTIKGYWYSYYYSVSRLGERFVSRDLCIIKEINDDGFIDCEIIDNYFHYVGVCFPIKGKLYFFLEKDKLFNEIIVYTTNLPDRTPPILNGVILCLSGGVDDMSSYPCASKTTFRYIGKKEEIPDLFNIGELSIDDYMRKNMPAYLIPEKDTEPENIEVYKTINNHIGENAVPFALRML